MTATQAPTPGPLMVGDYAVRLEDHPLVKAGEVHRVTEMFRGGYLGFAPPVGGEWNPVGWGKCDADGWMPWSGGENPVPGQRVQWRTRNETDRVMSVLSNNLDWTHECRRGFDPIIAFRLAPTAPVEASGSEREIDLYDDKVQEGIAWTMRQWGEALGLTTWTQGDGSESVEGDVGAEIHTILCDAGLRDPETNAMATFHPQTSGETR